MQPETKHDTLCSTCPTRARAQRQVDQVFEFGVQGALQSRRPTKSPCNHCTRTPPTTERSLSRIWGTTSFWKRLTFMPKSTERALALISTSLGRLNWWNLSQTMRQWTLITVVTHRFWWTTGLVAWSLWPSASSFRRHETAGNHSHDTNQGNDRNRPSHHGPCSVCLEHERPETTNWSSWLAWTWRKRGPPSLCLRFERATANKHLASRFPCPPCSRRAFEEHSGCFEKTPKTVPSQFLHSQAALSPHMFAFTAYEPKTFPDLPWRRWSWAKESEKLTASPELHVSEVTWSSTNTQNETRQIVDIKYVGVALLTSSTKTSLGCADFSNYSRVRHLLVSWLEAFGTWVTPAKRAVPTDTGHPMLPVVGDVVSREDDATAVGAAVLSTEPRKGGWKQER